MLSCQGSVALLQCLYGQRCVQDTIYAVNSGWALARVSFSLWPHQKCQARQLRPFGLKSGANRIQFSETCLFMVRGKMQQQIFDDTKSCNFVWPLSAAEWCKCTKKICQNKVKINQGDGLDWIGKKCAKTKVKWSQGEGLDWGRAATFLPTLEWLLAPRVTLDWRAGNIFTFLFGSTF